jgi:hypothetical protein
MTRWIARLLAATLMCAPAGLPAGAADAERTPLLGTPYGLAVPGEIGCPAGQYLVGVNLRYDTAVSRLQPNCARMTDDDLLWAGAPLLQDGRWLGEPRPNAVTHNLLCPRDSFVGGISAISVDKGDFSLIVRIGLRCTTRFSSGRGTTWIGSPQPEGLESIASEERHCSDNVAATGMFGRTFAGKLIQIGLICHPTQSFMTVAEGLVGADAATAQIVQPGLKLKTRGDVADTLATPPSPFGAPPSPQPGGQAAPGSGPVPLPPVKPFEPPLAKSGLRLYACQTVGGSACGGVVANAFCQQQGFVQAQGFDSDTQKIEAETLAGQKCTKKKCKVFERIVCVR